ncbi:aminodeoxychorismate lyase [Gordonia soli]|uniref:Putative aminotransferase n=1 Tax=Gordonia soli NBRC 108243 TaxID=1223545 RepID=M0QIZ8_9ACTN|nr:aminodeoxychorismate lyase [Gordonia soli]GAC68409.1 putative aminotransferase [Gordonia soli NBRC 108243]
MSQAILVTLDGTVRDPQEPFLYADDLAAVRGDGVFETLLVRSGRARCVSLHLDRLERSASALDLPKPDREAWRSAIEQAAHTWAEQYTDGAEGMLRLVYSRGRESEPGGRPTAYVTVAPVPARVAAVRADGVSVVTLERGYSIDLAGSAPWALLGAKTLSYATNMAALRHAEREGFDDVVFISSEGAVLEGPRSTVIAVFGRTLVTPPSEIGILPGTTQLAVFELAEKEGWTVKTEVLKRENLIQADSVWLVSSVTLAARVTAINRYLTPVVENGSEFSDLVDRAISIDRE